MEPKIWKKKCRDARDVFFTSEKDGQVANVPTHPRKKNMKIICFAGSDPANDEFCSSRMPDIQFKARDQTVPLWPT